MIANWLSRYIRYTAFSLVAGNRISKTNRQWFTRLARQTLTHDEIRETVIKKPEENGV